MFSCLCYVSVHEPNKFAPRAIRCAFMGYPYGHKGYRLLNLDTKQFFISRHVIFHETEFPFLSPSSSFSTSNPYFVQPWLQPSTSSFPDVLSSPPFVSILVLDNTISDITSTLATSSVVPFREDWSTFPPDSDTLITLSAYHNDIPVRKSTRVKTRPSWWHDYEMTDFITSDHRSNSAFTKYPIYHFVSFHAYIFDHHVFISKLNACKEPSTFAKAIFDPKYE